MSKRMRRWAGLGLVLLVIIGVVVLAGCPEQPGGPGDLTERLVRPFSGEPKLTFYSHQTGQKSTILIEDYLAGVVAGEMKPNWPQEAYAAQAVVARSFTLEQLSRGGTRDIHGTDICDSPVHAQAYNRDNITNVIRNAVKMTRGMVMVYRGRYVKAWFSASCGGETTTSKIGLAYKGTEPAYIKPVDCPERRYTPPEVKSWTAQIESANVLAALKKMGKTLPSLDNAQIGQRSNNRAAVMRFSGGGQTVEVPGASFRVEVGPELLRSIWLTRLEVTGGKLVAAGTGFGHGVGLCQWGSYAYAREGRNPEEIVKHYYPDVDIKRLWR